MTDAFFTTDDGIWFQPTDHTRGPWDPEACHAGPPAALMVRAMERLVPAQILTRVTVELMRPVPMAGFRVQAEMRRPGRSVSLTEAEIFDDDRIYVRAFGMHLRAIEDFDVVTPEVETPEFEQAVRGPFPIRRPTHDLRGFNTSVESRYDPEGPQGEGGPTTMWMRTLVPLLADEEPSGFQRVCPLADSGNGISFNQPLDEVLFVNTDLTISLHRHPEGEWLATRTLSHWQGNGIGRADAELFDIDGPIGRSTQNLLLRPATQG